MASSNVKSSRFSSHSSNGQMAKWTRQNGISSNGLMAQRRKFYSIGPGESLEELKRKQGLSLCELLGELDRIDKEEESGGNGVTLEMNYENLSEEDRHAQDQMKKLRGALNKLTPENFYIQLMEMQDHIPALNSHLFKIFVKQFVDKAIDETVYSLTYAHVCKALQTIELLEPGDGNRQSFGSAILEQCDNKFCYNRSSFNWWSPKDLTEADVKHLEAKDAQKRKKLVGTMRFIGNLFKANAIGIEEVFSYVKKLEEQENEKHVEGLCVLLATSGEQLEYSVSRTEFESEWQALWERILLLSKKQLHPRPRFLLMDLLDLRNGGWVPRFPVYTPKCIAEIQISSTMKKENGQEEMIDPVISNEPSVKQAEQEIMTILQSGDNAFGSISTWEIDNYKGKKTWFIYAMTRAVLKFCIVENSLNFAKFSELIELLKKYINSRQAEVSCMYAVQYIVVSEMGNPIGLLEQVCEKLHQTQTVSYIAFLDWRENWSKCPVLEITGKAQAHMCLGNFFIRLFRESIKPSSRYKSIVKELNSFDLEHFVSISKLPPEIEKRIKMEEEREKKGLLTRK